MTGTGRYAQYNTAQPTECRAPGDRRVRRISDDTPPRRSPVLADKKTYTTKQGIPRTEYLWRHPPDFEDAVGRTTPVLIPAGLTSEWKSLLDRQDNDNSCRSNDQTPDPQVQVRVPPILKATAQTRPNSHDTPQSVASFAKPQIPVEVSPRNQAGRTTGWGQSSSGRAVGHNSKVRGVQYGLAKKGSYSNLKGLVKRVSSNEGGLSRNSDKRHSGDSEGTENSTTSKPSDLDGPSRQLRREMEERATRELHTHGKMGIDKY